MARALELATDGRLIEHDFSESDALSFLQGAVDGLVEHLSFPVDGVDAWINEEGKIKDLDLNLIGTTIMLANRAIYPGDYIVGSLVLTGSGLDGETLGLTDDQAEAVRLICGEDV